MFSGQEPLHEEPKRQGRLDQASRWPNIALEGLPGDDHTLRLLADEEIHDRQIVRCEVPDDADVVLEEPEVDPGGVVIIEVAQHALVDQLPDLLHGPREQERVVDHDLELSPLGHFDQLFGLRAAGREGLLDEDVLSVLQRGLGELEMRVHGRHHGDGVDLG